MKLEVRSQEVRSRKLEVLTLEIRSVSLPGDYRVTDEALLAETT